MYVLMYVCIDGCMYEFPDDSMQEILVLKLFNIFCALKLFIFFVEG